MLNVIVLEWLIIELEAKEKLSKQSSTSLTLFSPFLMRILESYTNNCIITWIVWSTHILVMTSLSILSWINQPRGSTTIANTKGDSGQPWWIYHFNSKDGDISPSTSPLVEAWLRSSWIAWVKRGQAQSFLMIEDYIYICDEIKKFLYFFSIFLKILWRLLDRNI